MADVSLDDLIKKDKEKGRVTKLKQVDHPLRRNLKLPKTTDLKTDLIMMTEHQETTSLIKISLLTNVSRRSFKRARIVRVLVKVDHKNRSVKNLNFKRKKLTRHKEMLNSVH